jgi:hypothetical protein
MLHFTVSGRVIERSTWTSTPVLRLSVAEMLECRYRRAVDCVDGRRSSPTFAVVGGALDESNESGAEQKPSGPKG